MAGVYKYTDNNCTLVTYTTGYAYPHLQSLEINSLSGQPANLVVNQPLSIGSLLALGNISSFSGVFSGSGSYDDYGNFDGSTSNFFIFWDCFSQIETFSECQNCASASSSFQCSRDLGPYQQLAYEQAIRDCPDTLYLGNLNASIAEQFVPQPLFLSGSATKRYGSEECLNCEPTPTPTTTPTPTPEPTPTPTPEPTPEPIPFSAIVALTPQLITIVPYTNYSISSYNLTANLSK